MAIPIKTIQEYLCAKLGLIGTPITEQEAINRLAGTTGRTKQQAWNVYAGTTGLSTQAAANRKVGTTGRTVQECASLL